MRDAYENKEYASESKLTSPQCFYNLTYIHIACTSEPLDYPKQHGAIKTLKSVSRFHVEHSPRGLPLIIRP